MTHKSFYAGIYTTIRRARNHRLSAMSTRLRMTLTIISDLHHYFPSAESQEDYVVGGYVDINTHQWVPSGPLGVTAWGKHLKYKLTS
jgi:hypothetical protein